MYVNSSFGNTGGNKIMHGKSQSKTSTPKPMNIFYIWYTELCRRLNQTPLNIVKPAKPKNETVLDFVTDRIKPEEWTPIINALKLDTSLHVLCLRTKVQCKFMEDVTTEEKVRSMKRRAGSVWTPYIMKNLMNSITYSICRTSVLTFLELDGLPNQIDYLDTLLESIKKNKTIKVLSLKHCQIRDLGCEKVCQVLRFVPNIEVINLSSCMLSSISAQYIAKLIRYQQINRYCESWHSSLRYEDPVVGVMAGLKRVTLNNNPNIGDEGLLLILNELDDDLWIKAIDMQKCGITNSIANRLIDIVEYNRSLEIADFRNNEDLSIATIQRILDTLKRKPRLGYESEFQWCATSSTLPCPSSIMGTVSSTLNESRYIQIQKSKSTPIKTCNNQKSTHSLGLRRMKTSTNIPLPNIKENKVASTRVTTLADAKKEVLQLNVQLQKEISKRVQTEEENRKLKNEIIAIKSSALLLQNKKINLPRNNSNVSKKPGRPPLQKVARAPDKPKISNKEYKNDVNSINRESQNKKSVEFVFKREDNTKSSAQNLFHNLLHKKQNVSMDDSDKTSENEFDEFFEETSQSPSPVDSTESECFQSESNASLAQFFEEIKKMEETKKDRSKLNCWKMKKTRNLNDNLGLVT